MLVLKSNKEVGTEILANSSPSYLCWVPHPAHTTTPAS